MSNPVIKPHHRLLIVDDNQAIHEDFKKILTAPDEAGFEGMEAELFDDAPAVQRGPDYELNSAYQGQEALTMVEKALAEGRPYTLAFVDVRMPPGWDGVETTARIWQASPYMQIILCTAYSDYSWEDVHFKLGQSDRLVILKKPFDAVEVLQLAATLTEKCRLTQEYRDEIAALRRQVEEQTKALQATQRALCESEERGQWLFRDNPLPLLVINLKTLAFLAANRATVQLYGYSEQELLAMTFKDVHRVEEVPLLLTWLAEGNGKISSRSFTGNHRRKDGGEITVEIRARLIHFEGREAILATACQVPGSR